MRSLAYSSLIAVAAACGAPAAAQTSGADAPDTAEVARELAAMRAEMSRMAQRIDALEAELVVARGDAAEARTTAAKATELASQAQAGSATAVAWKGAPEFTAEGGWSFKPRGRIQLDAGTVAAPDGISDGGLGFASEVRRAYLGFDGKMPGGFGYRAEIDVASSGVELTDLYLTYDASKQLTLTVGQHKPFWGLEEMTSDLFPSFTERAAANTAFGFERRLGASAAFTSGDVLVQGGVFTDNLADLNDDADNSLSVDGRVVFMPKLAGGQLHLGGSAHYHALKDSAATVRYRARPLIHTTDLRFVDTGAFSATSETGYGLEAAYISGPFHVAGETHWQQAARTDATDPTFFGGYAEVGLFLTRGDTRGYKGGTFDRIKPAHPVGDGGLGAIQVNARFDYLDLNDAGIVGGKQNGYELSVIWTPTAYTRFVANYARLQYTDAAISAAGGSDTDYGVDAFGVRAQVDF